MARKTRSSTSGPLQQFGKRVRSKRLELGLSQEQLGNKSSLHVTYVGSIERGERNLALLNILKLSKALNVPPGSLLDGIS
jgi:transcriptional regulator with XRE-family HTH domain